ncbi:MAG TPA: hypothetical protein VE467_10415 [Chryseolinea sp.]|jgi:hypothetical protein|nr:hypothetical protein [Chryseolinea sp.]
MRNLVSVLLLFTFVSGSYAQAVVPANVRATNTLDKLNDLDGINTGDILYGIPLPEGKTIGDTYLDTHWRKSSILLYDNEKLIEGFPVRYDIMTDELEIKSTKGIKVLKGSKIKSFVWIDSLSKTPDYFVNAKDFKDSDGVPFSGFFQVLADGSLPLFKKTLIDIKKADYNIQFNVGSSNDKILKKNEFFALKENQVVELHTSRKKLIPLFAGKAEQMEQFIKENKLSSTKEEQLKIIFEHYNSLLNN